MNSKYSESTLNTSILDTVKGLFHHYSFSSLNTEGVTQKVRENGNPEGERSLSI